MNLDKYVVVSGISGVLENIHARANGLMVKDLDTGKTSFCSVRAHQFTPLGTVSIYTLDDTVALTDIFKKMKENYDSKPPVSHNAPKHEIQEYFEFIVPDYHEDKVKVSDMKKVIKWFSFLNDRNLLHQTEDTSEEE